MPYVGGFYASSNPSRIGVRSYRVPGTGTVLPVRSEIAPLLIGAARDFNNTVERLVTGWCWGYAYRAVTSGGSLSFHSAGIAIDLNAPRHPYGRRGTFSSADANRCRAIAKRYGLRWGGDFRGTKDEMHFEVIVGRSKALSLVRQIQSGGGSSGGGTSSTRDEVMTKLPIVSDKTTTRGQSWNKVSSVQALLGARGYPTKVDGVWGSHTKSQLIRYQRSMKLSGDGVVGPKTWAALLKV